MEKNVISVVTALLVGFLAGAYLTGTRCKGDLLKEIVTQQVQILNIQQKMDTQLAGLINRLANQPLGGADLSARVQLLEQRVNMLEAKLLQISGQAPQPQAQAPQPPPEDFTTVYSLPVSHTQVIGKQDAPVTITVFTDYQCPFCSRFHKPLMETLKLYPNEMNVVIKNFPLSFHPNARPAAKAALAAAEQGKYKEMIEQLLANQQQLSDAKYTEIAKQIGLDVGKFQQDLKNKDAQFEKYLQEDAALAEKSGVRGTPTFYLNGRKTQARDVAGFKQEIDQVLKAKGIVK
ncbi:MAG: thioredoxin domain-containing protein [Candidatus Omnitrophica bacterium]|nr:thioredoxin domain-containing protein [Candidatus Omnitrophota bacterium]